MRSAALFCPVRAAALFACFFPQFGQLVAELRELQFVGGAQIGDALFAVGLLTVDVGSGGIAFHGDGGKLRPEGTDLIPQSVTIGASLLELFPNTEKFGLGPFGPGGLRVSAADRAAGALVRLGSRSRHGVVPLECGVAFPVTLPHPYLECGHLLAQFGQICSRQNVLGVCLGSSCLQLGRQQCKRLLPPIQVLLCFGEVLLQLLGLSGLLGRCSIGFG